MSAPLCVTCDVHPVARCAPSDTSPLRGPRIVDGINWRWFCSRRCAGRASGRQAVQSGRTGAALEQAWQARRDQAARRQVAEIGDEVRALMGYGVPRAVAVGICARLVRRAKMQAQNARRRVATGQRAA